MAYEIEQGNTTIPLRFLLVQSADHISPLLAATPVVSILKANASIFITPSGAVTEQGNGWYTVAANATDASVLGPLVLHASASGADPSDEQFEVVAAPDTVSTSSGSTGTGAITVRRLIASALRLIGVLASGESMDADQGADGLVSLSQLLDAWTTERLTIYAQSRTAHALTPATARYTIGDSGADFTENRPLWIDDVTLILDARERPLQVLTRAEWAAIADKSQAGTPSAIFYNPAYPEATIDVWPVPDAACSLVIYAPAASITGVTSLNTSLSLPPGWARALRYNLALELAPEYDVSPAPLIVDTARDSKADIQRTNILDDVLTVDPMVGRIGQRRTFDGATGEYL